MPAGDHAPRVPTLASDARFTDESVVIALSDGAELSAPLDRFPRLCGATPEQRQNWRLIVDGIGIHWEHIDEDISVAALLQAR